MTTDEAFSAALAGNGPRGGYTPTQVDQILHNTKETTTMSATVDDYRETIRRLIRDRAHTYTMQKEHEQIMRERFGVVGECRDIDGCWGDPTLTHIDH